MSGYTKFDAEVYSEEIQPVSESEYDEVMAEIAAEGYSEWSAQLDRQPSIENFVIINGKVEHKPEPRSLGRINGVEL